MAAAPAAPPRPAAPLGEASRAVGGSEATHEVYDPAPPWTAPRRQAGQGSGAPRPPRPAAPAVTGRGLTPFPAGGRRGQAAVPSRPRRRRGGRGASSGFHLLLPDPGRSLSFRPPFSPSRSLLSLLHGAGGERFAAEGQEGPRLAGENERLPEPAPLRVPPSPVLLGAAADGAVRRSPAVRKSSRGTSGSLLSPASAPVSAGTPGWLLAAARATARLLGLLVLLSLSLSSPVVLCLSTTFSPAHYNAGRRRSQDKDLKGWWVGKQGRKGRYALISRIRAVISWDDSEVLLESYFTKLVCIFSCQGPPLPGYFEWRQQFGATSQSRARLPGVKYRMTYRWQSRTCYIAVIYFNSAVYRNKL